MHFSFHLLFAGYFCGVFTGGSAGLGIAEDDISGTETLQLVQIIIRHGARAPISPYPTDPYKNQSLYWPDGWTELTQIGLQQQVELGRYFRARYDGFLPPKYSHYDFHAESSDADRAIQSAEANLAGLYNNKSGTNDLPWQAVPIHTIPANIDIWINSQAVCPKYIAQLDKVYTSDEEVRKLDEENKDFIKLVSEKSGIFGATHTRDLFQAQDALRTEKFFNLTLPDWATNEVVTKLDHFKALSFAFKTKTDEMKRLNAGPLIGKIMENFKARSEVSKSLAPGESPFQDEQPFRKMVLFSGHDSTIGGVLNTLGVFNNKIPPFASSLMVEMHRKPGGSDSYVEIYYRNETTHKPYLLEIPGCGTPCYLTRLDEITKPFIPLDWDYECQMLGAISSPDAIPVIVQPLGISSSGLLGFAGGIGILTLALGSALAASALYQRLKGRSSFIEGPFGVNSYESFA